MGTPFAVRVLSASALGLASAGCASGTCCRATCDPCAGAPTAMAAPSLDPEAAGIWIDEAEALLGATDDGVRKARSALTEQLIAMESAKPIPASALKI